MGAYVGGVPDGTILAAGPAWSPGRGGVGLYVGGVPEGTILAAGPA